MNDRLKFRVWGVDYGKYIPENQFVITQDGELRHFPSGLDAPQTSFIIEQCTGLTDKNGRLIFEGDVLKTGIVTPPLPVFFVDGAFVYTYGNMGNYQLRQEVLVDCEIVGTIHDPEYQDQFRDATKKVGTAMSQAEEETDE